VFKAVDFNLSDVVCAHSPYTALFNHHFLGKSDP